VIFKSQEAHESDFIDHETAHCGLLHWLREPTATVPELADGLEESIVLWFLQSADLLPLGLGLEVDTPEKDLASAIRIIVQHGCLQQPTITFSSGNHARTRRHPISCGKSSKMSINLLFPSAPRLFLSPGRKGLTAQSCLTERPFPPSFAHLDFRHCRIRVIRNGVP
jgi:hypothetical protein